MESYNRSILASNLNLTALLSKMAEGGAAVLVVSEKAVSKMKQA